MATTAGAAHDDNHDGELWPIGGNKQLLYAMDKYIGQILQEHGTRLIGDELIKLSKLRTDMKSLLETLNGHDFQIPDLNFTLPGIYKFYTGAHQIAQPPNITPIDHQNNTHHQQIQPQRRHSRSRSSFSSQHSLEDTHSASPSHQQPIIMEEKHIKFDTFLKQFKSQQNIHEHINESSPQYLVFLEQARKQFNIEYDGKYNIKSLDHVPSLRQTLYQIRHIPQQSSSPQTDGDNPLNASSQSPPISITSSLFSVSKTLTTANKYDATQRTNIAIMGYFNTYLSVYKNGKSELKKIDIGLNEIFISMPITKLPHNLQDDTNEYKVYIKTMDDLYLGSDENGLLFLGNVTKHYQIWTVECNQHNNIDTKKLTTFSFRNSFGSYLSANKSGQIGANSKSKGDMEKFTIYTIDDQMIQSMKPIKPQTVDDEYIPIINVTTNRYKRQQRNKYDKMLNRNRKMSIDDMDIPNVIDKRLLRHTMIDIPYKTRKSKKGHIRRASARVNYKKPPPPKRRPSTPPLPNGDNFNFNSNNTDHHNKSSHDETMKKSRAPPPPRLKIKRNNELTLSLNSNASDSSENIGDTLRVNKVDRSITIDITESEASLRRSNHGRSQSMVPTLGGGTKIKGAVPAIGGMGMLMAGGDDLLMAELKRKLTAKKKKAAIDDDDKEKEKLLKEQQQELIQEDTDDIKLEDDDNTENIMTPGGDIDDDDVENDVENDNEDVVNDETEKPRKNKPALPPKSARRVVQKIRSKYQRPLPAIPQRQYMEDEQVEIYDHDDDDDYEVIVAHQEMNHEQVEEGFD